MNKDKDTESSPQDTETILKELAAKSKTPLSPLLLEPSYLGIATFFRLPHQEHPRDLDIALVGVPYDGGLTGRTGTRGGLGLFEMLRALSAVTSISRKSCLHSYAGAQI